MLVDLSPSRMNHAHLLYGAEAVGIRFDVLCMRNENAHLLISKFG